MQEPNPSDLGVSLGHGIFGFVEPHKGYEAAFNRWYERDHLIAAGACAPWTISTHRWVATRPLKALRYPERNPICQPVDHGSHLATMWIQEGRFDDQQTWVAEQMKILAANDRNFDQRDVLTTASYDYLGAAERDEDGVPPVMALDRHYPGIVLTWVERSGGVSLEALARWLLAEGLPPLLAGSPIASSLAFTPKPKASWWPKAAPEVPGVGERILLACFTEVDPRECWDAHFTSFGAALAKGPGCRTLLVAPFIPVIAGTDGYADQL